MRHALARAALVIAVVPMPGWAAERPPLRDGGLDSGWWVVVGSRPEPDADGRSIAGAVNAAAARCGFSAFNDFSSKFSGFRPGFEVFVIGAYRTKLEGARRLDAVRPCIPSAYLKFGRYAGE